MSHVILGMNHCEMNYYLVYSFQFPRFADSNTRKIKPRNGLKKLNNFNFSLFFGDFCLKVFPMTE